VSVDGHPAPDSTLHVEVFQVGFTDVPIPESPWDPMGTGPAVEDPEAPRQHFGAYHKEVLGFLESDEIVALPLSQLDQGPVSVDMSAIEVGPGDGAAGDCTATNPSGPIYPLRATKVILNDPIHLSIEARRVSPTTPGVPTPSNAVVRIATAKRGDAFQAGTTFLADPPWLLDELGESFEDPGSRVAHYTGPAVPLGWLLS
jgi:hypothetical protein